MRSHAGRCRGHVRGTMDGRAPARFVAGLPDRRGADCDVELRFTPDGTLTAELRRYLHVKTETKRSQAGDFKTVTRITGQPSRVTPQSSLFLWVTPSHRVQNAQWQGEPGPEFVGQVETEMLKRMGQDRWQRVSHTSRTVTVYCYPQVLWRGENKQGYGLPLRDSCSWSRPLRQAGVGDDQRLLEPRAPPGPLTIVKFSSCDPRWFAREHRRRHDGERRDHRAPAPDERRHARTCAPGLSADTPPVRGHPQASRRTEARRVETGPALAGRRGQQSCQVFGFQSIAGTRHVTACPVRFACA